MVRSGRTHRGYQNRYPVPNLTTSRSPFPSGVYERRAVNRENEVKVGPVSLRLNGRDLTGLIYVYPRGDGAKEAHPEKGVGAGRQEQGGQGRRAARERRRHRSGRGSARG